jgi:hypothetical protein
VLHHIYFWIAPAKFGAQQQAEQGHAQVTKASTPDLPPSSLLLWRKVLPVADSVYFGDFDTAFANQFFWSYKDAALPASFSRESIARAGAVIASALESIAMNAEASTPIDGKVFSSPSIKSAANAIYDDIPCIHAFYCM